MRFVLGKENNYTEWIQRYNVLNTRTTSVWSGAQDGADDTFIVSVTSNTF